ncbi:DUF1659 domain-containing protein [Bacillus lacus]|uniref:DUF1659 domain-containing protein n=1 Tax=Metabacillus lacus TaxID=1983721 RepID=A0A7X2LYW7_9BACI|nr:DUF1659 domain-containing protein [Metabacillus lacus]MRX72263.1 DUF1659 domain-containing protein [Metabacillus lacus]
MAETFIQGSVLRIAFENGLDENGKQKLTIKNYSNVKTTATASQLLSAAEAVISLQSKAPMYVGRVDTNHVRP